MRRLPHPYASLAPVVAASFALSGCAPEGTAASKGAPGPWTQRVSDRVEDDARAFVAHGDGAFTAASSPGLTARFAGGGAALTTDGDVLSVRTIARGRAGAMDRASPTPPRLGACVPGREDPEGACVQRLEYVDAGWTEWWAGLEDGFQQGWTVHAPPAGDGPLAIDVAFDGATVTVKDGDAWLDTDGEAWLVSGLAAWDADGAPLEARFERAAGGLRVRVEDAGARYPIEIDPVYTTASAILTGEDEAHFFGRAVSGAGDVDGDGYDDVIVGAFRYGTDIGRAYVFLGSSAGVSTTASATLTGEAASYFGYAVAGAGDVDHDGYDDVVVGAYAFDGLTGRAYVFLGSPSGVSTTPALPSRGPPRPTTSVSRSRARGTWTETATTTSWSGPRGTTRAPAGPTCTADRRPGCRPRRAPCSTGRTAGTASVRPCVASGTSTATATTTWRSGRSTTTRARAGSTCTVDRRPACRPPRARP
jgi:hypothetical protein